MTDTSKSAGMLILANLGMFNEAAVHFEDTVQPVFLESFDKALKEALKEPEWVGHYDFHDTEESGGTWFAPAQWKLASFEDDEECYAWFSVEFTDDETNSYTLPELCGLSESQVAVYFRVNYREFGGKTRWNKFYKEIAEETSSALASQGFIDVGAGIFYIPISLDAGLLPGAWENDDYMEIMRPVVEVVERINNSLPVFQDMLDKARSA